MSYMFLKTHLWSELFEVLLFLFMPTLVRVMRYRYMYNISLLCCVQSSVVLMCVQHEKKEHSGEFHAKFSCEIHLTKSSCIALFM